MQPPAEEECFGNNKKGTKVKNNPMMGTGMNLLVNFQNNSNPGSRSQSGLRGF